MYKLLVLVLDSFRTYVSIELVLLYCIVQTCTIIIIIAKSCIHNKMSNIFIAWFHTFPRFLNPFLRAISSGTAVPPSPPRILTAQVAGVRSDVAKHQLHIAMHSSISTRTRIRDGTFHVQRILLGDCLLRRYVQLHSNLFLNSTRIVKLQAG